MEIFVTLAGVLILGVPAVLSLIMAFCLMFDDVFGTYLASPFIENEVWPKGLAVSVMLLILSLPIIVICYFLGILN